MAGLGFKPRHTASKIQINTTQSSSMKFRKGMFKKKKNPPPTSSAHTSTPQEGAWPETLWHLFGKCRDVCSLAQPAFHATFLIYLFSSLFCHLYTQRGARTHEPQIKSWKLSALPTEEASQAAPCPLTRKGVSQILVGNHPLPHCLPSLWTVSQGALPLFWSIWYKPDRYNPLPALECAEILLNSLPPPASWSVPGSHLF